jgi:hypothetical protein
MIASRCLLLPAVSALSSSNAARRQPSHFDNSTSQMNALRRFEGALVNGKASVYGSQAASEGVNGGNPWAEQPEPDQEEHDTFPFQLDPPIVLVERLWAADQITRLKVEDEGAIIDEVEKYKGVFAGT